MAIDRYPIIKHWTPDDEERLREMHRRGARPAQIAEALNRTPKAVRNRANQLGLTFVRAKRPVLKPDLACARSNRGVKAE